MKEMTIKFTQRLKNRQFDVLIIGHSLVLLTFLLSISAYGADFDQISNTRRLEMLNPYAVFNSRTPANYVPEEELIITPYDNEDIWINEALVDDNSGVLKEIKRVIKSWNDTETYVKDWDLESTGLARHSLQTNERKKAYLEKSMLKYMDKRLSGEVRNAEKGSAFHKVGQVQKALRPNAKVQISKRVKVKFKARVLQGKAIVLIDNPFVKYKTVIKADGQMNIHLSKHIKQIGVNSGVDYDMTAGSWVARVDKKLTKQITGRISSTQSDKLLAFQGESNKKLEFFYRYSF